MWLAGILQWFFHIVLFGYVFITAFSEINKILVCDQQNKDSVSQKLFSSHREMKDVGGRLDSLPLSGSHFWLFQECLLENANCFKVSNLLRRKSFIFST
jgi:hypothetical protein